MAAATSLGCPPRLCCRAKEIATRASPEGCEEEEEIDVGAAVAVEAFLGFLEDSKNCPKSLKTKTSITKAAKTTSTAVKVMMRPAGSCSCKRRTFSGSSVVRF
jgi:hypothetical protein